MSTVKYADINGLRRFKENLEAEIPTKTSDLTNDSNFTKIVEQASAPSNPSTGDLWIDTDEDGYNLTVDDTVSGFSHNPVQNQAITNYVNTLTKYSYDETVCGTWFNGYKIYRKIIDITSYYPNGISSGSQVTFHHNISNFNNLINARIIRTGLNPLEYKSISYIQYINDNARNDFNIYAGNFGIGKSSGQSFYLIVEYTKSS